MLDWSSWVSLFTTVNIFLFLKQFCNWIRPFILMPEKLNFVKNTEKLIVPRTAILLPPVDNCLLLYPFGEGRKIFERQVMKENLENNWIWQASKEKDHFIAEIKSFPSFSPLIGRLLSILRRKDIWSNSLERLISKTNPLLILHSYLQLHYKNVLFSGNRCFHLRIKQRNWLQTFHFGKTATKILETWEKV